MAAIPVSQARAEFTQMLVAVYKERVKPTSFLRSFFPTVESLERYISIEVQRGSERVAVDVLRSSEGNLNTFERSTEKVIDPPYHREYFNITDLRLYDRLIGSGSIDAGVYTALLQEGAEKMAMLVDKIERAYELQCSQVLATGIVQVSEGFNIDYKRKAGSLVDNSSETWATDTNDPSTHFIEAGTFLRTVGKSQGGVLNAILGGAALGALTNNEFIKTRADIRNYSLADIREPQRNSLGAALHGRITAGAFSVNLWSYPEYYENSSGVIVPYIDDKKVIVLPENPNFKMAFGAVPQLLDDENPVAKKGAFVFGDYKDTDKSVHKYDVKSAGVAIPVAVDQIYTMQVLA